MSSRPNDVEDIHFKLPRALVKDLRRTVPRAERNRVVARAVEHELRRLRLLATLAELAAEPAWTSAAHPELATGKDVDEYVNHLRATWRPTTARS